MTSDSTSDLTSDSTSDLTSDSTSDLTSDSTSDLTSDSSRYLQLIDTEDIDGLFREGYLKLNVVIKSHGVEVIDLSSGQATFSPGFSATLTNTMTDETYHDQSHGCRVKVEDQPNTYKFTGGGFMEKCNILAIGNSYKVGLTQPFLTLITNPEVGYHISCADLRFVVFFLVMMWTCIGIGQSWMKPLN